MKLYGMPGACSQAAHIVLKWSGENFEYKNIKEMNMGDFKKINPAGAVPALDDNGFILTQNVSILNYIADKYPQKNLAGDGSIKERAMVNKWLGLVNSDLHPTFGTLFKFKFYPVPENFDKNTVNSLCESSIERIMNLYSLCNDALQNSTYIAGTKNPSIADAYLYVTLGWAGLFNMDLSKYTNLIAYKNRMTENQGVMDVLKCEHP